ncbi:unnamed protein product [Didymodactylos carnosus]|uniref:Carbohydrate sulfotransferase n=1 Tax=Didymodactylos carnosus TaxID=1234261 RepID=A0A815JQB6_9BILA|nr:unnamed protein product [Didymodactylos carnosus]CAF4280387.1 unnamed protein product [Didymodactylos carnosus]
MGQPNISYLQIMKQSNPISVSSFCKEDVQEMKDNNLLNIRNLNSIVCPVQKVASTNILRIILLTADKKYLKQTKEQNDRLLKRISSKYIYTMKRPFLQSIKLGKLQLRQQLNLLNNTSRFKFLFVRHPFRRIISAYYDKFIYPEEFEIPNWTRRKQMMLKTLKQKTFTLKTFLFYIVYSIEHRLPLDGHWARIVTFCSFCKRQENVNRSDFHFVLCPHYAKVAVASNRNFSGKCNYENIQL